MNDFKILLDCKCSLGENPLWDSELNVLYWSDIDLGKIYMIDFTSKTSKMIYHGEMVGGFTLQKDGNLLLFRVADIAIFNIQNKSIKIVTTIPTGEFERFNDVIATPNGNVFAGTIGLDKNSGGFYHFTKNGDIKLLVSGTKISNGFAFNKNLNKLFWSDSSNQKIFSFDYDKHDDKISNQQVFLDLSSEKKEVPDGITIDSDNLLYIAKWGGSKIDIYSQHGNKIKQFELPVDKVSSLQFGGENLNRLFVTTAGGCNGNNDEIDGALFEILSEATGVPEFKSSILLS